MWAQNPQLIKESGFKSRAADDGACTVDTFAWPYGFISYERPHLNRERLVETVGACFTLNNKYTNFVI